MMLKIEHFMIHFISTTALMNDALLCMMMLLRSVLASVGSYIKSSPCILQRVCIPLRTYAVMETEYGT